MENKPYAIAVRIYESNGITITMKLKQKFIFQFVQIGI